VAADACGGLARVVLTQLFRNLHPTPLAVTYAFPLPEDAAVSGYSFTVGDRRVVGEIDRRAAARERFEEALLAGKTAALLEQDRSTLFTQEIGNVPPGAEVAVELTIDQRLSWTNEGAWEWRFPTAAAPRYLGEPGRVGDAARVTLDVADAPLPVRVSMNLAIRDCFAPDARVESPSHAIRVDRPAQSIPCVRLASEEGTALDRDLVVRWSVADSRPGLTLDVSRPGAGAPHGDAAYGVLTIVPPASPTPSAHANEQHERSCVPRDLVILLDTSGSMKGEPLDQARRVVSALVSALGDEDHLEIIEFSSAPRRWNGSAVPATAANRALALAWLARLVAGGGTEMRSAIVDALAPLRPESQRQVVVVSDGHLGFEHEIVGEILSRRPRSSRVHTVGVGSAVNRSLTAPAARAGRGVEIVVGLGEDPERAARRIVAATAEPLVVDLDLGGSAVVAYSPGRMPDLYAGAPALVGLKLRPEGGEVVVRGRTRDGDWVAKVIAPPCDAGAGSGASAAFFARETVSDFEAAVAAHHEGEDMADLESRIERVGLEFQIATRLTSWVAVSEEPSVDPGAPVRRQRVPQQLPHGMSVEGLGLRALAAGPRSVAGTPRAAIRAPAAMSSRFLGRGRMFSSATTYGGDDERYAPTGAEGGRGPGRGKGGIPAGPRGFAAEPPPAPRQLHGRITLRRGTLLAVEFDVEDAPLAWAPGTQVALRWADASTGPAAVIGGTQPGTIAPGHTLRLVLRLSEGAGALPSNPVAVLVGDVEPLEILLS
jgi:Ca-activated chloride channel family protein